MNMDIVRSYSLPCIPPKEDSPKDKVPVINYENPFTYDSKPIYISPDKLKKKIKNRILQFRIKNDYVNNKNLRRFEKANEVKAFTASFVAQDQEIGKLFLVDRKVQKPPTPGPMKTDTRPSSLRSEFNKQRPLKLPPPQLPPIYKIKPTVIKSRDYDIEPDIFMHNPTLEERLEEIEDCRYLRRFKEK
ncbi:uncharacterized protein LOC134728326 [Mytilus trossulus]|uniref:uncharacterized protein LOC134728326 n=1 Tax=Mytilus trossulus TaxID=6551 RepID=UPI003006AB62